MPSTKTITAKTLQSFVENEVTRALENAAQQTSETSEDCDEDIITQSLMNDDESEEIEVELRTNPTLQEISEKTENFTVLEKEPGLLFRVYDEIVDDKALNSKVIQRIRWLLRELKEDLIHANEKKVHEILNTHITLAYKQYMPNHLNYQNEFKIMTVGKNKYVILLNTLYNEFVSMNLVISR
jgi:hypothetical protein